MTIFRTTLSDHVLHIRFGSPDAHNIMRDEWFAELDAVLLEAASNGLVRCLRLSAEGKSFCSGGDLRAFLQEATPEQVLDTGLARCLATFETFDKPIVAVVHGAAIGGGATILLHCDFVYAEPTTTFQLPFTRLGVVPELGSTALLPLHAGRRLSAELLLLARHFDAATAVRAGLVTEVLPRPELESRADETAATLASLAPSSMRATKRLLKSSIVGPYGQAWRRECEALAACFGGAEVREACQAFLEKRPPDFSQFS